MKTDNNVIRAKLLGLVRLFEQRAEDDLPYDVMTARDGWQDAWTKAGDELRDVARDYQQFVGDD